MLGAGGLSQRAKTNAKQGQHLWDQAGVDKGILKKIILKTGRNRYKDNSKT